MIKLRIIRKHYGPHSMILMISKKVLKMRFTDLKQLFLIPIKLKWLSFSFIRAYMFFIWVSNVLKLGKLKIIIMMNKIPIKFSHITSINFNWMLLETKKPPRRKSLIYPLLTSKPF